MVCEARPGGAAVGRAVEARADAAVGAGAVVAMVIPERGVDPVRVRRVERDVEPRRSCQFGGASTSCQVCAAVGRAVDAALAMTRRSSRYAPRPRDPVRVRRVDDDPADRGAVAAGRRSCQACAAVGRTCRCSTARQSPAARRSYRSPGAPAPARTPAGSPAGRASSQGQRAAGGASRWNAAMAKTRARSNRTHQAHGPTVPHDAGELGLQQSDQAEDAGQRREDPGSAVMPDGQRHEDHDPGDVRPGDTPRARRRRARSPPGSPAARGGRTGGGCRPSGDEDRKARHRVHQRAGGLPRRAARLSVADRPTTSVAAAVPRCGPRRTPPTRPTLATFGDMLGERKTSEVRAASALAVDDLRAERCATLKTAACSACAGR